MDNSVVVAGYKYYRDADSGERPAVFVTFVNVVDHPQDWVNGVLIPVDAALLAAFDIREHNYDRVDVTCRIVEPIDGTVWAYFGKREAVNRHKQGLQNGTAVVARSYYEKVRSQFELMGEAAYRDYLASTDELACPLADLVRVDL